MRKRMKKNNNKEQRKSQRWRGKITEKGEK